MFDVCVYVFCLFTPFLLVFCQKRHIGKYILDISELFIQCNTDSCCKHITGGVNIYLYECVNLLAPECAVSLCECVCVCVCVGVISNQSTRKKPQTSVNLKTCCIKFTARSFWYKSIKTRHV